MTGAIKTFPSLDAGLPERRTSVGSAASVDGPAWCHRAARCEAHPPFSYGTSSPVVGQTPRLWDGGSNIDRELLEIGSPHAPLSRGGWQDGPNMSNSAGLSRVPSTGPRWSRSVAIPETGRARHSLLTLHSSLSSGMSSFSVVSSWSSPVGPSQRAIDAIATGASIYHTRTGGTHTGFMRSRSRTLSSMGSAVFPGIHWRRACDVDGLSVEEGQGDETIRPEVRSLGRLWEKRYGDESAFASENDVTVRAVASGKLEYPTAAQRRGFPVDRGTVRQLQAAESQSSPG